MRQAKKFSQIAAAAAVNAAVNTGKLKKPTTCSACGKETESRLLHGHHTDYSKRLDVVWLCVGCHRKEHAKSGSYFHRQYRRTQTFEPCGPIMEMLNLEMNNRTRGRRNHHGEKRRMFEDLVATALGKKYPKLMERFEILRHEEIN